MLKHGFKLFFVVILFVVGACEVPDQNGTPVDDKVAKFLGTWNVNDQPARLNYIVKIERSPLSNDKVVLNNFADLGGTVIGLVVNNNMVIDGQNAGSGFTTEGSGFYVNEEELQFEFFLDNGIDKELRQAVFTK